MRIILVLVLLQTVVLAAPATQPEPSAATAPANRIRDDAPEAVQRLWKRQRELRIVSEATLRHARRQYEDVLALKRDGIEEWKNRLLLRVKHLEQIQAAPFIIPEINIEPKVGYIGRFASVKVKQVIDPRNALITMSYEERREGEGQVGVPGWKTVDVDIWLSDFDTKGLRSGQVLAGHEDGTQDIDLAIWIDGQIEFTEGSGERRMVLKAMPFYWETYLVK